MARRLRTTDDEAVTNGLSPSSLDSVGMSFNRFLADTFMDDMETLRPAARFCGVDDFILVTRFSSIDLCQSS